MSTTDTVSPTAFRSVTSPRRRGLPGAIWQSRTSYIMLLPFFIPFIIFGLIPMIASIYLSFTDYNGASIGDAQFIGTDNFSQLLSVEIKYSPRLIDEDTNEVMFRCGRSNVPESEVEAEIADGESCAPAYTRSRDILSEGYSEFRTILGNDNGTYIIGAKDSRFWTAMFNTVTYVIFTVVARVVLGLLTALALQNQSRLNMYLRTIFFLPSVTSTIAITVVWGYLFTGKSHGLINSLIATSESQPIEFLADPNWTMPILILLTIWGGIGYNMILFLAGLQNIPNELYEAATVDGATTQDKFRHITLPLLRPTTIFIVITSLIGSFQIFDSVYVLFASPNGSVGGTQDSVLTIVTYLYESGFRLFNMGYASAIAWILFVVIFVLSMINLRIGRAGEAY